MLTVTHPLPVLQPVDLPVLGSEPRERADAARNRQKVLEAAACLFAREGADRVSMEAVAAHAGVGKGTLFRRFGDRASLARAVISEQEARFQDALIRGEPPVGPGAPPHERLLAFGRAYLEFLEANLDTLLAAESGGGFLPHQAHAPYAFYRTHVTLLLREAGCGDRADYLADVLLSPLASPTFKYHRELRGLSVDELAAAYADLVARLLDSPR
jgi:AcrR family transcriptional regulator